MNAVLFRFCALAVAGWIHRGQENVIEYLVAENRVLHEQLGGRRLRLTDDQRRRLAVRAKALGRSGLQGIAGIVTPGHSAPLVSNAGGREVRRLATPRPGAIAGIAHVCKWMEQVARRLTDPHDGFLRGTRYLIHYRDPLFTARFAETPKAAGLSTVKLPPRSLNLNAYAERFVLSAKQECLRKVIPFGEAHLRKIVAEYVEHYHRERNHQGCGNQLIEPTSSGRHTVGAITCRERLGGTLRYYHREAA